MKIFSRGLSVILLAAFGTLNAFAAPIYLNNSNMTVAVGSGTTATSSNNTFSGGQTIEKVIDAPSADAEEFHNQTTHIWYSGGGLELLFDFGQEFDITTLHFWNFTGESFDVDNIDFTFFNNGNSQVGALSVMPELGSSPGILAQDISLAAPLNVQFVTAFLTGTNAQIDFQNIGFTAEVSVSPTPSPTPTPTVSEPTTATLLALGLLGAGFARKRRTP